jgi:hypothetical protein
MYSFLTEYFLCSPCASRHQVPCSASQGVPGAHRVVGHDTHQGSGPREGHTTAAATCLPNVPIIWFWERDESQVRSTSSLYFRKKQKYVFTPATRTGCCGCHRFPLPARALTSQLSPPASLIPSLPFHLACPFPHGSSAFPPLPHRCLPPPGASNTLRFSSSDPRPLLYSPPPTPSPPSIFRSCRHRR